MPENSKKSLFKKRNPASGAETQQQRMLARIGKGAIGAVSAVLIFGIGVNFGNGRFQLHSSSLNKQLPSRLDYASLDQVYAELKGNFDGHLDANKLVDGLKSGLVKAAGDPYTEYFSASEAKQFNEQLSGTFTGIGAELGQDTDGNLQVVAPIDGFPAAKAGLRSQDLIIAIDGNDTSGMSIAAAVNRIRGPKGTTVKLTIIRDNKTVDISITRDDIKIPSVKSQVIDNVGYLQITQFSDDTAQLARQAADDFQKAGVKAVVLDLRDNPGGLLEAAVDISSLWLPANKKVVQEKRGSEVVQTHYAKGGNTLGGIPTAVLINEGSASASEILAGALRDNNAATLFGAKSYGKGSVQTVLELAGGAELKVTVARWYRPNGQNIDKKGIMPDKVVKVSEDDLQNKRDPQKDAAFAWAQNPTQKP